MRDKAGYVDTSLTGASECVSEGERGRRQQTWSWIQCLGRSKPKAKRAYIYVGIASTKQPSGRGTGVTTNEA